VRNWNLTINKDALETTCLGELDRRYVPGLRGATGSADVLYDPAGPAGGVFNTIFEDNTSAVHDVAFVLSTKDGKQIGGKAIITSVNATVSVGEVQASSVSFQISGPLAGGW
jgi:hypothetical protein